VNSSVVSLSDKVEMWGQSGLYINQSKWSRKLLQIVYQKCLRHLIDDMYIMSLVAHIKLKNSGGGNPKTEEW